MSQPTHSHVANRKPEPAPAASVANPHGALWTGGLAALLASVCCLGPLLLVLLGFSGAWIGTLTVLEPYRPWFLGIAVIALAFAYRGIFRSAAACLSSEACATTRVQTAQRTWFWAVAALVLAAIAFPYVLPWLY
jgi:mercuric ion transport protein